MSIREVIKSNTVLRKLGKKYNIVRAFYHDMNDYSRLYLESAEKRDDYRYRIMLLVHSIEKGLCMSETRPFGEKKILMLIEILNGFPDNKRQSYEFQIGLSALFAWRDFYDINNWAKENNYKEVTDFISNYQRPELSVGYKIVQNKKFKDNGASFDEILSTRHSVRDFQHKSINMDDIEFAVNCFLKTPTACNRQMCKVYYITNEKIKGILDDKIIGISGVNKKNVNYFVITYELSAFDYSGERNQGLFNSGLCAMNFVNALHVRDIGSCCFQWSNKYKEDAQVRDSLKLSVGERIAIVIGAGYYLEESLVPCSCRKDIKDIFKVI